MANDQWGVIFPGQGSQSVGMGKVFYDNFQSARLLFEEASDTLALDFKRLLFEGPESDLALTHNTQPALLLVSTAMYRVLKETTALQAIVGAGHSLGEYSALVAAESFVFSDGLRAVRKRGEAMQRAVPVGNGAMMAVLGASDEDVEKLCGWVEKTSGFSPLEPANFNSPGQVVISGSKQAVDWCRANFSLEDSGLTQKPKFIPLNVSAPFHCSMMKPAQETMSEVLSSIKIHEPQFPIIQNVSAEAVKTAHELREGLIQQVTAPVRWTQSIKRLQKMGVSKVIEVGSGRVLAGLLKKIDSDNLKTFNVQTLEDLKILEQEL